ncbi:MAG TPA: class A beta-lactamase-related serine hydrolase [Bacillota bacterium]|nr:class A beta-lactamase-related serine hydrolase [Bacillota bacterium]HPE38353.1 class A beta-lactamase-related serine hydrolase [Bacillota bacterium]
MKHNSRSNDYNIYSNKRRRNNNAKRTFAMVCLLLCAVSLICIVVFGIMLLVGNGKSDTKATVASSSIPLASSSDSSVVNPSDVPTDTTPAAPTAVVDAATREQMRIQLESDISTFLSSQSGRYSVAYINLTTGETIMINETAPMVAASSIKLAFNTYLYKQAAAGVLSLSDTIAYNAAPYPDGDLEYGTGTIQNSADGTSYTLSEVSGLSIRISDNCGTNMVLRALGGIDTVNTNYMAPISHVVDYRTSVSYTDYTGAASSGRHRTSAIDLAYYAQELYNLYKADPTSYEPLINDLCNTEYSWGVPAGVPQGTSVAHKIGFNSSYGTNNDVGIVFSTEDYVLCVMTETGDGARAQENIGAISSMVYDYISTVYGM